jgi:trimeric autotransporter adhesin
MSRWNPAVCVLWLLGCGGPSGTDGTRHDASWSDEVGVQGGADAAGVEAADAFGADAAHAVADAEERADVAAADAPLPGADVGRESGPADAALDLRTYAPDGGAGGLVVSPTYWGDSNTLVDTEGQSRKFTLTNRSAEGTGPITAAIEDSTEFVIKSSTCGPPLLPDQTCELSVAFKPISLGERRGRLVFTTSSGGKAIAYLEGTSVQPFTLDPKTFNFPDTPIATPAAPMPTFPVKTFTLTNPGRFPVPRSFASASGTHATLFTVVRNTCNAADLPSLASCSIDVRFAPTSAGRKEALLQLDFQGGQHAWASLSGTATEPARLVISPALRDYGSEPVGDTLLNGFEVSNFGTFVSGPLMVTLVGDTSDFDLLNSCTQPLARGARCTIYVDFAPKTPGPKTATVRVTATPGGTVEGKVQGKGI